MDKSALEVTALQLKSLLTVLCTVDGEDALAMVEMPTALIPAAELAEKLYCGIINMKEG